MNDAVEVVVWLRSARSERIAEAYRAAIGLGLRGCRVALVCTEVLPPLPPQTQRAANTLRELGHLVETPCSIARALELARSARAVELWT